MTMEPLASRKAVGTRFRLLQESRRILAEEGLSKDIVARAATRSGCPVERAKTFFQRDQDIVLALYTRFAVELEASILELPTGTVSERFVFLMKRKFAILQPHRHSLLALRETALDKTNELGVLNPQSEMIRARVQGVFLSAVYGASNFKGIEADSLAKGLYAAHLALVLMWCRDTSDDQKRTKKLIDRVAGVLPVLLPLLSSGKISSAFAALSQVVGPLSLPVEDEELAARATRILEVLLRHRRLLPDSGECQRRPCPHCIAVHISKVKFFVRAELPIHLVLPGFPAKSPCRKKTLGPLPDKAEEIALKYLNDIALEIRSLYSPGVRLTLCSDGHVFSELVGVSDTDVSQYGASIETLIEKLNASEIDLFAMTDLYEEPSFDTMRKQLLADFSESQSEFEQRARRHEHVMTLVNGIERFLLEERILEKPTESKTQLRRKCRQLAYQVVRHSDAWGRLLADCFPFSLRLSIHPQHPHSEKFGILLGESEDVWLTPWHGCALLQNGKWSLLKRNRAEEQGAKLVYEAGVPSYFTL
jgi:pyoverdine/dityrosine biosynthesis protein Dit1